MSIRELKGSKGGKSVFDRLADGEDLPNPKDAPDLRGYVDLALTGGFPAAAIEFSGSARENWLASYVESLVLHEVELSGGSELGRQVDPDRVRRYFEALALNTSGVVDHRQIYETATVSKQAGENYERMLRRLMVVDHIPAWSSNRFRRLVKRPKRYVIDPSLVGAALALDTAGVMADGNLLGRLIDTFVVAQLRPELAVSKTRPRLYHLRTQAGRQEIDLVVELGGGRLIGIEIKAGAAPTRADSKHLAWLRDQAGDRFVAGVVLHTGPLTFQLEDKITAVPIASIWS
jgi:predicted AAA+ superfamily ATPase